MVGAVWEGWYQEMGGGGGVPCTLHPTKRRAYATQSGRSDSYVVEGAGGWYQEMERGTAAAYVD